MARTAEGAPVPINTITIEVRGTPIAKARPRFARRGKFVSTYNPQTSEEGAWIAQISAQLPPKPLEGPLSLTALFDLPIPASWSQKKRNAALAGDVPHVKKPDVDNLVKWVKDCLNGLAWIDDCQVVAIDAAKRYAPEYPKTLIQIKSPVL